MALACGLAVAPASANMPVNPWEIGPINAVSSSGVGFCSMKNFYQDGHGLVVARDAEGSNSLAISFDKKILQAGGQYTVSVRADDVQRQMTGLAGTPQVLILQLGMDREFYLALQKKNSLEITLHNGAELHFGLDSTGDALEALTLCATTIAAGKTFAPVSVAIKTPLQAGTPVLAPEPAFVTPDLGRQAAEETLRNEVERLTLENQKLMAENQAAAEKMQSAAKPDAMDGEALASEQLSLQARVDALRLAGAKAAIKFHKPKPAAVEAVEEEALEPVPVPKITAKPDTFLQDILKKSNIAAKRDGNSFLWTTKELFGAAEMHVIPEKGSLTDVVRNYVEQARSRCAGDFAHNESSIARNVNGIETIEGEFACIDGENDAAAALLFVSNKDKVAIIAHEGTTGQMEDALSIRYDAISNLSR